jgi:hypothetical protein
MEQPIGVIGDGFPAVGPVGSVDGAEGAAGRVDGEVEEDVIVECGDGGRGRSGGSGEGEEPGGRFCRREVMENSVGGAIGMDGGSAYDIAAGSLEVDSG